MRKKLSSELKSYIKAFNSRVVFASSKKHATPISSILRARKLVSQLPEPFAVKRFRFIGSRFAKLKSLEVNFFLLICIRNQLLFR